MEIIGWLGSIMLSICGLPQAYDSFKKKNSDGISWGFILLWVFGEIFAVAYVIYKKEYPIIFNCALNIVLAGIILYYKVIKLNLKSFYLNCAISIISVQQLFKEKTN